MSTGTGSSAGWTMPRGATGWVLTAARDRLGGLRGVVGVTPGAASGRPVIDVWVTDHAAGDPIPTHCHGVPVRLTCLRLTCLRLAAADIPAPRHPRTRGPTWPPVRTTPAR
jgi:hypothetical protein